MDPASSIVGTETTAELGVLPACPEAPESAGNREPEGGREEGLPGSVAFRIGPGGLCALRAGCARRDGMGRDKVKARTLRRMRERGEKIRC